MNSFMEAYSRLRKCSLSAVNLHSNTFACQEVDLQDKLCRWEDGLSSSSPDTTSKLQLITILTKLKRYKEAEELLDVFEHEEGEDVFVQLSIARLLHAERLFAKARKKWDNIRIRNPHLTEPLINLATIAIIENQLESALTLSEKILSIAPEENKALLIKARAYHRAGKWVEALHAWRNVIKARGRNFESESQYATALYYTENYRLLIETIGTGFIYI